MNEVAIEAVHWTVEAGTTFTDTLVEMGPSGLADVITLIIVLLLG